MRLVLHGGEMCFAGLLVAVVVPGSCAPRPIPPPGPGAVFAVEEPSPVTAQAERTPRARALQPRTLAVDLPRETSYVPWEWAGAGSGEILRVERTEAVPENAIPGAEVTWQVRRYLVAADGQSEQHIGEDRLILTTDGNAALAERIDLVENVIVVFDPPLLVLPQGMSPGQTIVQDLRMTVHPGADRSRVQAAGDASHEIVYVGDERIRVPLPDAVRDEQRSGLWDAHRLRTTLTARLGTAHVVNRTDQWYVSGIGIIAEERHERTTAFGLRIRESLTRWAAAATGPGSADAARQTPAGIELGQHARE